MTKVKAPNVPGGRDLFRKSKLHFERIMSAVEWSEERAERVGEHSVTAFVVGTHEGAAVFAAADLDMGPDSPVARHVSPERLAELRSDMEKHAIRKAKRRAVRKLILGREDSR